MAPLSQIAIVEQHGLLRRGLESLLADRPAFRLAAVAARPDELADEAFDVIVYGAPPASADHVHGSVSSLARYGRVLVVSDLTDWQSVSGVLRAGAFGCVGKQADDEDLLRAVETVARGGLHVSPGLAARLLGELRQPAAQSVPLAHREEEALRWLAAGLTHSQIARRMGLTEATVSTYVKRIRNKLNVGNKAELTRKAIELGLVGAKGSSSQVGRAA